MPNFVCDCFTTKAYFLQVQWGFDGASSQLVVHAYEDFLIEVGLYVNIFSMDFNLLRCLVTDGTWFKNFYEFASHLNIQVNLAKEYHLKNR